MLNAVINLVRVRQWYKNLLVFLALIFAGKALSAADLTSTIIGFIALCLASGAVYIFNDFIDLQKDRAHPDNRNRPLASGKISTTTAALLGIVFAISGLGLAAWLSFNFALVIIAMLVINLLYSTFLQRVLFVDVITISVLLLLRAVGGAVLLNVVISPWLLLCAFLLALFLALAKRKSDLFARNQHMKEQYTAQELDALLVLCLTALLVSYSIYSFFTHPASLMFWLSVPVAFFLGFRFLHFTMLNHRAARNADEVFYDQHMLVGMAVWLAIVIAGIYFK